VRRLGEAAFALLAGSEGVGVEAGGDTALGPEACARALARMGEVVGPGCGLAGGDPTALAQSLLSAAVPGASSATGMTREDFVRVVGPAMWRLYEGGFGRARAGEGGFSPSPTRSSPPRRKGVKRADHASPDAPPPPPPTMDDASRGWGESVPEGGRHDQGSPLSPPPPPPLEESAVRGPESTLPPEAEAKADLGTTAPSDPPPAPPPPPPEGDGGAVVEAFARALLSAMLTRKTRKRLEEGMLPTRPPPPGPEAARPRRRRGKKARGSSGRGGNPAVALEPGETKAEGPLPDRTKEEVLTPHGCKVREKGKVDAAK
jgi:hypothetical protein